MLQNAHDDRTLMTLIIMIDADFLISVNQFNHDNQRSISSITTISPQFTNPKEKFIK